MGERIGVGSGKDHGTGIEPGLPACGAGAPTASRLGPITTISNQISIRNIRICCLY